MLANSRAMAAHELNLIRLQCKWPYELAHEELQEAYDYYSSALKVARSNDCQQAMHDSIEAVLVKFRQATLDLCVAEINYEMALDDCASEAVRTSTDAVNATATSCAELTLIAYDALPELFEHDNYAEALDMLDVVGEAANATDHAAQMARTAAFMTEQASIFVQATASVLMATTAANAAAKSAANAAATYAHAV